MAKQQTPEIVSAEEEKKKIEEEKKKLKKEQEGSTGKQSAGQRKLQSRRKPLGKRTETELLPLEQRF